MQQVSCTSVSLEAGLMFFFGKKQKTFFVKKNSKRNTFFFNKAISTFFLRNSRFLRSGGGLGLGGIPHYCWLIRNNGTRIFGENN